MNLTDRNGYAALHWAAEYGSAPVMRDLLEAGGLMHQRASGGVTALHLAAASNHVEAIDLLAGRGR